MDLHPVLLKYYFYAIFYCQQCARCCSNDRIVYGSGTHHLDQIIFPLYLQDSQKQMRLHQAHWSRTWFGWIQRLLWLESPTLKERSRRSVPQLPISTFLTYILPLSFLGWLLDKLQGFDNGQLAVDWLLYRWELDRIRCLMVRITPHSSLLNCAQQSQQDQGRWGIQFRRRMVCWCDWPKLVQRIGRDDFEASLG